MEIYFQKNVFISKMEVYFQKRRKEDKMEVYFHLALERRKYDST